MKRAGAYSAGLFSKTATALVLLHLFSVTAFAQSRRAAFQHLSKAEKRWVFFHPFAAKKAQRISLHARAVADSLVKAGRLEGPNGGAADAFRHAYWMASLVQEISPRKARKLGEAHEKGNYEQFKKGKLEDEAQPDSAGSVMDLLNNDWGIRFGEEHRISRTNMITEIIIALGEGNLKVMRRDTKGHYLDRDGKHIDMELWKGKWNVPKKLVPSGHAPEPCSGK